MTQDVAKETRKKKAEGTPKKSKKLAFTRILYIIDQSGSIAASKATSDVMGGFNTYMEQIATDGNTYRASVVLFNDTVTKLCNDVPLAEVPRLTETNYAPSGWTALDDAIGMTLETAKTTWGTKTKPWGTEPVILFINTDGLENASKLYTRQQVITLLQEAQAAGNWTVTYIGANHDAWSVGQSLGLHQGNTLTYDQKDVSQVYRRMATNTSASATMGITSSRTFFNP